MTNQEIGKYVGWGAATLGSALIGVMVTAFWNRAQPTFATVDFDLTMALNERYLGGSSDLPMPERFQDLIAQSVWTSERSLRNPSVSYEALVEGLDENETRMRTHRRSIHRFSEDRPRIKDLLHRHLTTSLSADDEVEFYDLWERNDEFIYGTVRGGFRRGDFAIEPTQRDGDPVFQLYQEQLGAEESPIRLWVVNRRGGAFPSVLAPRTLRGLVLNRHVAEALAYLDVGELRRFLVAAEEDAEDLALTDQILEEIGRVREHLSRIVVTVLIQNAGAASVVVLPHAELEVDTTELVHNDTVLGEPTRLDLSYRNEGGELEPIQIEGSSARLVRFATRDYLMDAENGDMLVAAFKTGGTRGKTTLFTAAGGAFVRATYVTRSARFVPASAR